MDFETLVYTDCRPGQGLRGGAGLQFQARSSDHVAAAETLVKDHLLYEPPARWMADRRPVADYPRSFGHLCASGYYATATGLYLGREANGVREGNQLTHAIVTTDAESYRGLRPAQLFGADFWTAGPAPTTRSEPVTVSPAGGPYSPARAKKFVLEQPDGPAMLLALVSALEQAGRHRAGRVLFVGDDVGDIVEWLVAGTLLVPRARALELGFKIYTNDPARSSAPIVAVHPEFAGAAARRDNQLGYLVFDLIEHRHSEVAPSDSARRWVRQFLEDNPRDAVDALDVAAESTIDDPAAAAALGLAAILHEKPSDAHAVTIVGWLRHGPQRLLDAYGADLADLFAELPEQWSRDVLRLLDEVGGDGLLPGKAAEVRIALLLKDIQEAVSGGRVTPEPPAPLPPGEWDAGRDEEVRSHLLDRLRASERTGEEVEALLQVAHRYGADIHPARLDAVTVALARYLADHPRRMRTQNWPNGDEMETPVLEELHARAARGGAEPAHVGDEWGVWLLRRRELLSPGLRAVALGSAVRRGDDRRAFIRDELDAAGDDPDLYAQRVKDLFSQSPAQLDEMELIYRTAPDHTPPLDAIFRSLTDAVGGKGAVTPEQLSLCRKLVRRQLIRPANVVEATLGRDEILVDTLAHMRGEPKSEQVKQLLQELADTPTRLIEARREGVVVALLSLPVFRPADKVFTRNPALFEPYVATLLAMLRKQDRPELAAMAFYLQLGLLKDDKELQSEVGKAVDHWLMWVPEKRISAVTAHLSAVTSKSWTEAWTDRVEKLAGKRKRYRMTHLFGGRS